MKKLMTAILLGLTVMAAAESPAATQAQTPTSFAGPTDNVSYQVWVRYKRTGEVRHYATYTVYEAARRRVSLMNKTYPNQHYWIKTVQSDR